MTYDENILDSEWLKPSSLSQPLARRRLRLCNFLIDYFIGGTLTALIIGALLGFILAMLHKQDWLVIYQSSPYSGYYKLLMSIAVLICYYTFCEYVLEGKTLGKFITGTRTVSQEGTRLTLRQVVLRSVARFIPLETFSVLLGHSSRGGWHDQISRTRVILDR